MSDSPKEGDASPELGWTLSECKVELFGRRNLKGVIWYGLRLRNDRGGVHEFGGTEPTPQDALKWLYEVGVFLETWMQPRGPGPEDLVRYNHGKAR
jgi:hypothetical protein